MIKLSRRICSPLSIMCFSATLSSAHALDLKAVLGQVRTKSPEFREAEAERERHEFDLEKVEAAFDTQLFANTRFTDDHSEQQSIFAGESRTQRVYEVGMRKFLATGTQVEVAMNQNTQMTYFAPPEPPQPGAFFIDPSTTINYNPAVTTNLSMTIRQPLYRNFMAREVTLQKLAAKTGLISAISGAGIKMQSAQFEAEQLYWNLLTVQARIETTRRLLKLSQDFASSMSKRAVLGRADSVDVASSEFTAIEMEGALLDLEILRQQLRSQLAARMSQSPQQVAEEPAIQELFKPRVLGIDSPQAAFDMAMANRFDIKMIEESKQSILAAQDLAKEKSKPQISLIGNMSGNGLDRSGENSFEKLSEFDKYRTLSLGLEISINIGDTENRASLSSAAAQSKALEAKFDLAKQELFRDLDSTYIKLMGARRQQQQAQRQIDSLKHKRNEEQRKVTQARSDEVAVLRYDIEILGAESSKISAHQNEQISYAQLNFLMHAYPRSTSL